MWAPTSIRFEEKVETVSIVLTFDTDWMKPESMDMFIKQYPDLPESTFFIHDSSFEWRPDIHESAPHPTLASLNTNPKINQYFPALGVRTHSCVSSHMLSLFWSRQGFQYESNTVRFLDSSIQPHMTAWGIWELPIFYMDNIDLCFPQNWSHNMHKPLDLDLVWSKLSTGIYVFDFHPLHIALNTRSFDEYQSKKNLIHSGQDPWKLASSGFGVRSFFEKFLDRISKSSFSTLNAQSAVNKKVKNYPRFVDKKNITKISNSQSFIVVLSTNCGVRKGLRFYSQK